MQTYKTPGVYRKDIFPVLEAELRTGVPAFLGFVEKGPINAPQMLTLWVQFQEYFGNPSPNGYLAHAVRGFFENGGTLCYVVALPNDNFLPAEALHQGLETLAPLNSIDLICAPDITRQRQSGNLPPDPSEVRTMQAAVLEHCDKQGDRFAILDSLPGVDDVEKVLQQRQGLGLEENKGKNGALYYPWVCVPNGPSATNGFVPPCGHVAGVYARSDRRIGVHKAPANEVLEGVLDLQVTLTDAQQGELNPKGVNCLRVFSGRGIRVWGARTLTDDNNAEWMYVNVRRLFLTAGRWIERTMASVVFEPNDYRLWARISRELTGYFNSLFQRGALKGSTPQEAFYVKCDAQTNPREVRDLGQVVTELGLAPASPSEFVVVRIIHSASGVTIIGPIRPEQ